MPVFTPVIATGELALIEAIDASPELHVPPAVASENDVVAFWHIDCVPVMAEGFALTVNTAVERQEPIV